MTKFSTFPPSSYPSPRIAIAGITGRLGKVCAEEAGAHLIGGLSRTPPKDKPQNYFITSNPEELASKADVVIDVSHENLVIHHAKIFAKHKAAWVIGTTGLSAPAQEAVKEASKIIPVLQAANFSPALTLLLDFAEKLGKSLSDYDAEILEIHHKQKQDAPSGTALAIGRAVALGREQNFEQVARFDQNGKRIKDSIGFASLRGGQVIGEHALKFFSDDEEISLTHRALDRRVFAKGALKAAFWLAQKDRPQGLYHMRDVLGLS